MAIARHASNRPTKLSLLVKAAEGQPRWKARQSVPLALAEATDCRSASVYRWIDGSRRLRGEYAERVAAFFGVRVEDVIGFADDSEEAA